jgi:hypothetical protein
MLAVRGLGGLVHLACTGLVGFVRGLRLVRWDGTWGLVENPVPLKILLRAPVL